MTTMTKNIMNFPKPVDSLWIEGLVCWAVWKLCIQELLQKPWVVNEPPTFSDGLNSLEHQLHFGI